MDILAVAVLAEPSPCRTAQHNSFCTEVTYDTSLPGGVGPAELDAAARADYEVALPQPGRPGKLLSAPACLDAWKSMQCASKFARCEHGPGPDAPVEPLKVCRSLCVQFANACNASETVLHRCGDALLYSDPPCTDYAAFEPPSGRLHPLLSTSPAQLLRSKPLGVAAGLPLAFALVVVLLHALCCVVQCAFTGGGDKEGAHDVAKMEAREALRDISADGGPGGLVSS